MPIIRTASSFSIPSSLLIRYCAPVVIPRDSILRATNTRSISSSFDFSDTALSRTSESNKSSKSSRTRSRSSMSTAIMESTKRNSQHLTVEDKKQNRRSFLSGRSGSFSSASVNTTTTTDGEGGKAKTVLSRKDRTCPKTFWDFEVLDSKGKPYPLSQHRGKVILVVNTASKCGFTPQLAGLEELYNSVKSVEAQILRVKYPFSYTYTSASARKHAESQRPSRFEILAFPCNQFGAQDPGTNAEINSFCLVNYGVTFPVLKKLDVNGPSADPLWEWMKAERSGFLGLKRVKWNFEKFLIGPDGLVEQRWTSISKPDGTSVKVAVLKSVLALHGCKLTSDLQREIRRYLGAGTIYDASCWGGDGGGGSGGGDGGGGCGGGDGGGGGGC